MRLLSTYRQFEVMKNLAEFPVAGFCCDTKILRFFAQSHVLLEKSTAIFFVTTIEKKELPERFRMKFHVCVNCKEGGKIICRVREATVLLCHRFL